MKERERKKGVNFNVIKMGKRKRYSGMNKERKRRKKEKRVTHFET